MQPTIVAGLDPEAPDPSAVSLARAIAELIDARVLVIAVRPGGVPADRMSRLEPDHPGRGDAGRLAAGARELLAPSPAAGLHRVLEAEGATAAVIGSSYRAPIGQVLPGSTAERLMHGAMSAVALAPRGYLERPLRTIVVAALPSRESRATLRTGAQLARGAGVPLRVVMVLRRSPRLDEARALAGELTSVPLRALEPAALLSRALASAAGADVDATIVVGDPVDALVRLSRKIDLLLLGARAYGPRGAVLTGGVAWRVLTGARCPVMVVPRAQTALVAPDRSLEGALA